MKRWVVRFYICESKIEKRKEKFSNFLKQSVINKYFTRMELNFLRFFFYSRKEQINDRWRNFSEEFNIFRDMISRRPKFHEKVAAFNSRFVQRKRNLVILLFQLLCIFLCNWKLQRVCVRQLKRDHDNEKEKEKEKERSTDFGYRKFMGRKRNTKAWEVTSNIQRTTD